MEVSKTGRCYEYGGVVDLRKGAPGLSALVGKPDEDALYLFSNRRRSLLKFLSVDKVGTWVGALGACTTIVLTGRRIPRGDRN